MRRELPRRIRAMRPRALRIRWRTGAASYARVSLVLKTGLAAAPLAPFIAPLVGARTHAPQALGARAATLFAALLVFVMIVRAFTANERRSQREAVGFFLSAIGASALAAHVIAARATAFFIADLLYEVMAVLLALSALSAALRTEPARPPETGLPEDGQPFFSPYHALSDSMTRISAWLIVAFWGLAVTELLLSSAVMLALLSGAIGITVLLRAAENVMPSYRAPRRWRATPRTPSLPSVPADPFPFPLDGPPDERLTHHS